MAGGGSTPELVAAVSAAGGLGFLAGAYLTPEQILAAGRAVRERTERPFGLNLFAPLPAPAPADPGPMLSRLARYHAELGLPEPVLPEAPVFRHEEQFAAALECGAAVFSFTFGLLPESEVAALHARGTFVIGTATTVTEAVQLAESGVDAVVVQGSEAGAHRGTFAAPFEASFIGTLALVPQTVDAVEVPVIASGGIMDGRGIAAVLALGASAVQMGTAFLTTEEAGIPEVHKQAIFQAHEHETRVTRAFSGRPARGIVNRFMAEVESSEAPGMVLPYPLQNDLTRTLRTAAARQGRPEFLSLWAGQGLRLARRLPAGELVAKLVEETAAVVGRLRGI